MLHPQFAYIIPVLGIPVPCSVLGLCIHLHRIGDKLIQRHSFEGPTRIADNPFDHGRLGGSRTEIQSTVEAGVNRSETLIAQLLDKCLVIILLQNALHILRTQHKGRSVQKCHVGLPVVGISGIRIGIPVHGKPSSQPPVAVLVVFACREHRADQSRLEKRNQLTPFIFRQPAHDLSIIPQECCGGYHGRMSAGIQSALKIRHIGANRQHLADDFHAAFNQPGITVA
ncbi:hypothetical protein D3C73_621060 [compost metagenome]